MVVHEANNRRQEADDIVNKIKILGGHAIAYHTSLLQAEQIIALAVQTLGGVHVLVSTAHVAHLAPFDTATDRNVDVVVLAPIKGLRSTSSCSTGTDNDSQLAHAA